MIQRIWPLANTIAANNEACHTFNMDKERILVILREHEPELKAAGLLHLRLFGSVARGDNTPASDIDLLADFDHAKVRTLFSMTGIENSLIHILGKEVHLSSADAMYPQIKQYVLAEAILAF